MTLGYFFIHCYTNGASPCILHCSHWVFCQLSPPTTLPHLLQLQQMLIKVHPKVFFLFNKNSSKLEFLPLSPCIFVNSSRRSLLGKCRNRLYLNIQHSRYISWFYWFTNMFILTTRNIRQFREWHHSHRMS